MIRCQVFDMNGKLIKFVNVVAGSESEVWNGVKASLMNGVYMMRYGEMDGSSMHMVQVRK